MSSYYNKGMKADTRELQTLFYGASAPGTKKRAAATIASGANPASSRPVNKLGWTYEYVSGLSEHAILSVEVNGEPLRVKVYKQAERNALSPHQDLCLEPGNWDISFELLESLSEAAEEARRLLKGQYSDYFKIDSFWK